MHRITIAIDDELLGAVDTVMAQRGYTSRSEAIRDMLRARIAGDATGGGNGECVAALTYVYDHETRALANRIVHSHHDHHDLTVASLHVHLDHDACLEVSVLRGPSNDVAAFADGVAAQRGVRHASLHAIPVRTATDAHGHGTRRKTHPHIHA